MTQADIEDIAIFAAQRGISVLKIGVSSETLAAYNKLVYAGARIVLGPGPLKAEPVDDDYHRRFPNMVHIIDLGPEAK